MHMKRWKTVIKERSEEKNQQTGEAALAAGMLEKEADALPF